MMPMLELGGLLGLTVVGERDGRMVVSAAARLRLDPHVRRALKVEDFVKAGRDRSMEVDVEGLEFDFRAWKASRDVRLKGDDAWAVVAVGGHDIPVSSWTMRVSSDAGVSVARAEFDLGGRGFCFESRPASFFVRSRNVYDSLLSLGFGVEEEYEDEMASVSLVP